MGQPPIQKPKRPPLRYYGGKWRIAPHIVRCFPEHSVYVEAFGGGGSVLLNKDRCHCEVYNERSRDVWNVFRVIRDQSQALVPKLYWTPYSRDEYYAAYEPTEDPVESARRVMFRAAAGFGADSLYRRSGFRTTLDDGRYSKAVNWATLVDQVPMIAERLRGVIIENDDAMRVMRRFDKREALHYVDPPYLATTRKKRQAGYEHEFQTLDQHLELLKFLPTLKGKVVLSGYESPLYAHHLVGWHKVALKARDQTNSHRSEMLWCNFKPEARA